MLRTNRFTAVCVFALSAALVALPGCGGDSQKETYKKEAKKAGQDFKNSAQAASAKIQASPTREGKIAGLTGLKTSVTKAADDFSSLKPPDDVKQLNSTLVTELRSLAGDVDQIQTALRGGDQATAKSVVPKLQIDQGKIIGTISQIEQKVGK